MPKREKPNKWSQPPGLFTTHAGDVAVIAVAAMCTLIFIAILFSHWHLSEVGAAFADPKPAKVAPKPETDMMLFPAQPPKKNQ